MPPPPPVFILKIMKKEKTERGFAYYGFRDAYGAKCSVQKSSAAMKDYIWVGIDDANPEIMASQAAAHGIATDKNTGWIKYPIPDDVVLQTRMHLDQKQTKLLIEVLQKFVDTGEI